MSRAWMQTGTRLVPLLAAASVWLAEADAFAVPPTPRNPGITALTLVGGLPDAEGLIMGKPNPNSLRPGDDVLFANGCGPEFCGWAIEVSLQNDQVMSLPVTFENIKPSNIWRVHPATPLTPGMYTLQYHATRAMSEPDDRIYVFRVEGEPHTRAPEFQAALMPSEDRTGIGENFWCSEITRGSRGPQQDSAYVQGQQYARVIVTPVEPLTNAERGAYLGRVVRSPVQPSSDFTEWRSLQQSTLEPAPVYETSPDTCFVVETMRASDLQVNTSEEHCFHFTPEVAPYDPLPFKTCKMMKPAAYAKAWCDSNRVACAPDNPRASASKVQDACAGYADVCATFLGKRAQDEMVCP